MKMSSSIILESAETQKLVPKERGSGLYGSRKNEET